MPSDSPSPTSGTLLLRQVHPAFLKPVGVSGQAFIPSRDGNAVSVDNGDLVGAEEAHRKYTGAGGKSVGVFAVSAEECESLGLAVVPDPLPGNPAHVHIVFPPGLSNSQKEKLRNKLADFANIRRAQFLAKGLV